MSALRLLAGFVVAATLALTTISAQIPGRNVNMVAGTTWPDGDPFLQRQNEPSIAASTRNPLHLLAGSNDYRTVDLPGLTDDEVGDAWLGLFKSYDGGQRWTSTLLPGYPQDTSAIGAVSPIKGYGAGADAVVRAGTNGLMYYAGLVFDRANPATPDVPGKSAIFVARYIDNNNKEAGDTFEYLGTRALQKDPGGVGGNFLDKPWMVVDIPRDSRRCTIVTPGEKGPITQSVPAGPVYVAYTLRSTDNKGARYDVMFTRSIDCGNTWTTPVKLNSNSERANQGATLAVDPRNGDVYIGWRQFDLTANGSGTDALMVVKYTRSTNVMNPPGFSHKFGKPKKGKGNGLNLEHFFKKGGVNKALEAVDLTPLDQSTSAQQIRFRTNAYPTMTVDENGRVYLAWAERGFDPNNPDPVLGSARVLTATSSDGKAWTAAKPVSNESQKGHQLMPSLTYAGGKLMLIYYDIRETRSQSFTKYIDDKTAFANLEATGLRHTIDLRASMAAPGANPIFANSVKVSEYIEGPRVPGGPNVPWQVNPPNLPMFQKGTAPFIGDYIDVAAAPNFIRNAAGNWIYNNAPASTLPIFHAAWTDNRDVRVPLNDANGDGNPWNDYVPPGFTSATQSIFDANQTVAQCVPGNAGSRNQNIYTARITGGLLVGSPGNSKTLSPDLQRGFVVFVQNTGDVEKTFRLSITNQPVGGRASWEQFPLPPYDATSPAPLTIIETIVPRKSTASRTVYITSTDPHATVNILVAEINGLNGAVVSGGLDGKVVLNPDVDNPDIDNPDVDNPDVDNPDIDNVEVYNPDIDNPHVDNPDLDNPDVDNIHVDNPDIDNPDVDNVEVANPDIDNPDVDNPDVDNPDVDNPDVDNPDVDNPDIDNASLMTDVSWPITNTGNTTAAYNVNLFFAQTTFNPSIKTQLILYRTYRTPIAQNCLLKFETKNIVVANVPNPQLVKSSTGEVSNPNDPDATNATIYLAPGETATITLRVFDPSPDPGSVVTVTNADGSTALISNQFVPNEDVTPVIQQQAVDTIDAREGETEPEIVVQFPPPETVADNASTAENTPVKLNVLANDSIAFGSTKVISFHPAGMAAHSGGQVGDIAFQPSSGFVYTQRGAVDPVTDTLVGRFNLPPPGTANLLSQIANLRTGINYGRTGMPDTTSISALDARPDSQTFHQYLPMPVIGGVTAGMALDSAHHRLYVLHQPRPASPATGPTLTVIDVNPNGETFHDIVRTVALPQGISATGVAVNNRTQRVYVTATGLTGSPTPGGVFLFDPANPAAGATRVPNSATAWGIVINEAANLVFATSQAGNQASLLVIDGATNALATVPLGVPMRFNVNDERLAVHEASGKVYLRLESQVVIFDGQRGSPTRNTVIGVVGVGRESGQTDIAVDQELGVVITVGNHEFQADIIDVASNALLETLPLNFAPTDVAIDPLSHRAFVGIGLSYVQEVDLALRQLREKTPVFVESGGVLLNPSTNKGYAGLFTTGPQLVQLSGAGFEGPISDPQNLLPTAGRFVYSAWHTDSNQGFFVNMGSPDGTGADPGSVIVIDGATNSVKLVGDVLPNPFGIAVDQETGHIYVASLAGAGTHGGITRGNANNLEEDFPDVTGPSGAPLPDGFPLLSASGLIGFVRNPVVNPANHKVYVMVTGGTNVSLAMLDPATNRVHPLDGVAGTPIYDYLNPGACGGGDQPACVSYGRANLIAVDASLNRMFIGYGDQTTGIRIVALDSATNTVAGVITAGGHSFRHSPSYLVVNEPSNEFYVTNYNTHTIQKYNSASLATVGAPVSLPDGPSAMAYNVLAKRIYVSSIDDKMLTAIDAGSMTIMSSVRLPLVAYFLFVDEQENRIYTSGGDSSDESGVMVVTDVLGKLGTNVNVTSVGDPQHGAVVLNEDNSVTYTPAYGYSGPDQFTYNIEAPTGTAVGTVHINVLASAPRRLAFGDGYNVTSGQELSVPAPGPLGNDAADGSMNVTSQPEHGSLVYQGDGQFLYTPNGEYTGPDSFSYVVNSESGDSNEVNVTINVNPSVDIVVINDNDSGPGSLRTAINTANVEPGSTIRFEIPGAGPHVIVPGSALPAINSPITINGYSQAGSSPNTGNTPGTDAVIKVHLLGLKAGGSGTHGLTINGGGTTVKGLAIGGWGGNGIFIDLAGGNVIEGNFIGTLDGVTAQPNFNGGIVAQAGDNTIGGSTFAARNLISGNTNQAGIRLQTRHTNGVVQVDSSDTAIKGNLIGTTASGLAPLPNGNGISIQVPNVVIGGTESVAERNVIAGNANTGISTNASTFDPDGNGPQSPFAFSFPDHLSVRGNYIGLKADGSGALANSGGGTITGSYSEIIGNVISGNSGIGISISSHADGNSASPTFGRAWTIADHTVLTGNIVGLDPAGTFTIANTGIGINVTAPDVQIGGSEPGDRNVISGNSGSGISLSNNFLVPALPALPFDVTRADGVKANGDNAVIRGNYIGLSATGDVLRGNVGNAINVSVANVEIGGPEAGDGNRIALGGSGINLFRQVSTNTLINAGGTTLFQNNVVGLFVNGARSSGGNNGTAAITVQTAGNNILNNTIAGNGLTAEAGSTSVTGISLFRTFAEQNVVRGNFVGTNAAGAAGLGNTSRGIVIQDASNNTIGGPDAADRNVVSGNGNFGISLDGTTNGVTTGNNVVQGNYVGVKPDGFTPLGNTGVGINMFANGGAFVANNTVGGTTFSTANIIGGNTGDGISLGGGNAGGTHHNIITGNLIGIAPNHLLERDVPAPNGGNGIFINNATDNTLGGADASDGNRIANNGGRGIVMQANGVRNTILSNSIYANANLGIDLGFDGVSNNDNGDGDTGANNKQNFPVITQVDNQGAATSVTVDTSSFAGGTYRLQFFATSSCDAAGHGEGEILVGDFSDISPSAAAIYNLANSVADGAWITATATDANGNTSEFSACALLGGLVVTNTNDSGPGSLRQMILNASNVGGTPTISFAIPGVSTEAPARISIRSELPPLSYPVVIDASTQNGYDGLPVVEVHASAGNDWAGFNLTGNGITIRGFSITGFMRGILAASGRNGHLIRDNVIGSNRAMLRDIGNAIGIEFNASGSMINVNTIVGNSEGLILRQGASGNNVLANRFGIEPNGQAGHGNDGTAITLAGGANNNSIDNNVISANGGWAIDIQNVSGQIIGTQVRGNRIGLDNIERPLGNTLGGIRNDWGSGTIIGGAGAFRNIISGNGGPGVWIAGNPVTIPVVQNNYIGTDGTGTIDRGNTGDGIIVVGQSPAMIGGAAAGIGNVISGNDQSGIRLSDSLNIAPLTFIQGNIIGLNANGNGAVGNTLSGILLANSAAAIGGSDAGMRNVISGTSIGIALSNSGSTRNTQITGNYIGTDISGTVALGNTTGILIGSAPGTRVGGSQAGAGNLISGNTTGISIEAISHQAIFEQFNSIVEGNVIGLNKDRIGALPNVTGISINNSFNQIGNNTAPNLIAGNSGAGVAVSAGGTRNHISQNQIYSNGGLGIDLGNVGVTLNDNGDNDIGANGQQNFPVLSGATNSGGQFTSVNVDLSSFIVGNYTIEFFTNGTCDASGHGEGPVFVGSTFLAQPGNGNVLLNQMVPAGQFITATARDSQGSTSEFSACTEIDPPTQVVNTNDSGPGSLRQAMLAANAAPGRQTITFSIPGAGPGSPATISINTALPFINESVIIDATTQPGYDGKPVIELTTFEGVQNGLITNVLVAGVTIKGLSITNFSDAGILLLQDDNAAPNTGHLIEANIIGTNRNGVAGRGNGLGIAMRRDYSRLTNNFISGNTIAGVQIYFDGDNIRVDNNFIGLSPVNTANALANASGIRLRDYPNNALIENNYISGNTTFGIDVQDTNQAQGPVTGTIIRANNIGLNPAGVAVGNADGGIRLEDAPGTRVGDPGAGNIISGNGGPGVWVVTSNGNHPRIRANRIGTDPNGVAARPNSEGIRLGGTASVGGDSSAGEGNLIAGNGAAPASGTGILIDPFTVDVSIFGNVIGLNANGDPLGNGYSGITVAGFNTTIGGAGILGNVISGNPVSGIAIYPMPDMPLPSGVLIRNNKIGTDATGTLDRGNGRWGITINAETSDIGTGLFGEGNVIAFNGTVAGERGGIHVTGESSAVRIISNIIHSNNGLGIDLDNVGVTDNDNGDADIGPNARQNSPVLTYAANATGNTVVGVDLSSFTPGPYTLQFYVNPSCDASGYGEGKQPLATFNNLDSTTTSQLFMALVAADQYLSAVAIDANRNTSEFSNCARVEASAGTEWAAAGDGFTARNLSGGTYLPQMTYRHNGQGIFSGNWTFTTISASAGNIALDYNWQGFHSFFRVTAGMQVFVNRGGVDVYTRQVLNEGPEDCGACNPPSNGFTYTGTEVVNVLPGDTYGFRLSGSHFDGTHALQGRFRVEVKP